MSLHGDVESTKTLRFVKTPAPWPEVIPWGLVPCQRPWLPDFRYCLVRSHAVPSSPPAEILPSKCIRTTRLFYLGICRWHRVFPSVGSSREKARGSARDGIWECACSRMLDSIGSGSWDRIDPRWQRGTAFPFRGPFSAAGIGCDPGRRIKAKPCPSPWSSLRHPLAKPAKRDKQCRVKTACIVSLP